MQRKIHGTLNSFFFQARDLCSVPSKTLHFIVKPFMTSNQLGGLVFGRGFSSGPKVTKDYETTQSDASR
jgi:hypothetical protein